VRVSALQSAVPEQPLTLVLSPFPKGRGGKPTLGWLVGAPGGRALPVSSVVAARFFFVRVLGAHSERDSAARGELRDHHRFTRCTGFHEVVQNPVCDGFVERALVPIRGQIKFQRLALDAETVWYVIDVNPGEIGLTGDRTDGCEIVGFEMDPVIPVWRRIWESLKARLRRGGGNSCFGSSEQS